MWFRQQLTLVGLDVREEEAWIGTYAVCQPPTGMEYNLLVPRHANCTLCAHRVQGPVARLGSLHEGTRRQHLSKATGCLFPRNVPDILPLAQQDSRRTSKPSCSKRFQTCKCLRDLEKKQKQIVLQRNVRVAVVSKIGFKSPSGQLAHSRIPPPQPETTPKETGSS